MVPLLMRLVGHEGSVHGVRWCHGGACLVSVSDDRSARIWAMPLWGAAQIAHSSAPASSKTSNPLSCFLPGGNIPQPSVHASPASGSATDTTATTWTSRAPDLIPRLRPCKTLWGHTARLWDAKILGPLAVTASEDCTVKLWSWAEGRCLATLQVGESLVEVGMKWLSMLCCFLLPHVQH